MTTVIAYGLPTSPVPPPPIGAYLLATADGSADNASIFSVATDASVSLLADVGVGTFPDGIAASPDGLFLAVANSSDNTVSIIRASDYVVLAAIAVGANPITPAFSPDGELVAVTNYNDNTVSIIELSTLTVIETVAVGNGPLGICFALDGSYFAVSEQGDSTISTVETAGWTITNTGAVGTGPAGLDIAVDGSYIAVADSADNNVYIVDPAALTVSQTIPVGSGPVMAAIDPGLAFVVCSNNGDGTVSVIETAGWTVTNTITVGANPYVLDVAPDSSFVAVPNSGDDTLSIIRTVDWAVGSTTAVTNPQALVIFLPQPAPPEVGEFKVATANTADNMGTILEVDSAGVAAVDDTVAGSAGADVAVSPDGALLAVTNPGDNTVTLLETTLNSPVAIIDVGNTPSGVAFSKSGDILVVANKDDNTFSVIDVVTRAVTDTVGTNVEPFGVCFAPDDSYLVVSHADGVFGKVLKYDTSDWSLLLGVDTFASLRGIDVASDGSFIAVAGESTNDVFILDPVTLDVTQTIVVGTSPVGVRIDPDLAFVVVSNSGDNDIFVIDPSDWSIPSAAAVGPSPGLLDIAPDSSFVAVPNSGDDTITIVRTSDWAVASTTSGVATNPAAAVVYTPAATPDEPIPKALKNTWRWVVQGLDGVTKSFLDKLATNVQVGFVLDDGQVMTCDLPSDHFEVYQHANDGNPRVDYGIRVIYGLRRETRPGKPPWKCRFAGLISIMQDQATQDEPVSHLTAYDPWMWAKTLPVLNPDGSLLGSDGLTYEGKTADYIARDLIANAYAWIVATFPNPMPWSEQGDIVHLPNDGEHNFIDITTGRFQRADVIPTINFSQGTSVGEAWTQLCQTGTIDIVLTPVYGRPGILCVMNVYKTAGKKRPNAVFGWDMFPRNLVGVDNLLDGTLIENYAQYWAGNKPVPAQQSTSSINKYGPYYVQRSYPAPSAVSAVELLALAEVALRKQGKKTLVIEPSPGLAPDPFTQWFLGDQVPVWAGRPMPPPPPLTGNSVGNALRSAIRSRTLGANRVYGFVLDLSDDLQETVTGLLLTDPNESIT